MAVTDEEREAMVQGLVGLRRVRGLLPSNSDVELGISGIKAALGEAVSQRVAARSLGISHPELSKLITDGRLLALDTTRGRSQVSVESLVELIEAEGATPREQPAWKQRRAKREAEAASAAPADKQAELDRILRMRALAFHRALARNLDRAMIERAGEIVEQWRGESSIDDQQADAWAAVLELPTDDVVAKMTDYSPAGDALRKQSPFELMGRRESDPQ